MQSRSSHFFSWLPYRSEKYSIILLILTASIIIASFYDTSLFSNFKSLTTSFSFQRFNSALASLVESETTTTSTTTTTETTTTSTTTETTTTTTATTTTTPFEIVINMDDLAPSYKLATRNGTKPSNNGPRNQLVESLQLCDKCRQDASTIIADVGANLGDFGLYAAACGCRVYMFETQPVLFALIQISIRINGFSPSSVDVYHNLVSDLPVNSTFELTSLVDMPVDPQAPVIVRTMRLDQIRFPSPIFILKIDFDDGELEALRSADGLFRQRRVHHLLLHYDSVANDQKTKEELIEHVRKVLRPKAIYVFHPTANALYGPLNFYQLKQLASQRSEQRSIVGLYATFDPQIKKASIGAEPYDQQSFFA